MTFRISITKLNQPVVFVPGVGSHESISSDSMHKRNLLVQPEHEAAEIDRHQGGCGSGLTCWANTTYLKARRIWFSKYV